MNEHTFIRSIHRLLPHWLYAWKINDNFQGGVADAYYSGKMADCWVEYKYVPALPKRPGTLVKIETSPQQKDWLHRRYLEGRNVFLVVGSPDGCLWLSGEGLLLESISRAEFIRTAIDKKVVAARLTALTTALDDGHDKANHNNTRH